jgi:hypothetical protein
MSLAVKSHSALDERGLRVVLGGYADFDSRRLKLAGKYSYLSAYSTCLPHKIVSAVRVTIR